VCLLTTSAMLGFGRRMVWESFIFKEQMLKESDPYDKAHSDIKIEVFTKDSLFNREEEIKPIVDEWLYERDVVMFLGSEKAGKSLCAVQMGMEISNGGKFLGRYQCAQKKVFYLQTEGKRDETVDRIKNINQVVPVNPEFFIRAYKKFCPLNLPEYFEALDSLMTAHEMNGGVFILDCLYMAMVGDLNDNQDVREFISALTMLLEKHSLTCIFVHHSKRDEYHEGKKLEKGDKSSYGSVFLRANIDHIIFLDMCGKSKIRTLSCDTQRSGKVSEPVKLMLIEPSPLHFKVLGDKIRQPKEEAILYHLEKANLTKDQLIEITKISKRTIDSYIKNLLIQGDIDYLETEGQGTRQKIYGLHKNLKSDCTPVL